MSIQRIGVDAMMPRRWISPLPLTCLAAAWIVLASGQVGLSAYPTRHSIAHVVWNHGLLALLVLVLLGLQVAGRFLPLRGVGDTGLSLAALGLGGRALVEVPLTCMERWPPFDLTRDATPILIADATRFLGLAAYAVGLTLFAVEIAGWWVDRQRARD